MTVRDKDTGTIIEVETEDAAWELIEEYGSCYELMEENNGIL